MTKTTFLPRGAARISKFLSLGMPEAMFQLHYQDIYSTENIRPTAREALLRWSGSCPSASHNIGLLIQAAESTGRIVELGKKIMIGACRDAAEWPDRKPVAVNVSPLQFQAGDFASQTLRILAQSGLPAERLHIEITENEDLVPTDSVNEQMERLHSAGVAFSLDDFGTSYSSLKKLQRFSFDAIKIDRTFVAHSSSDYKSRQILAAVADLGLKLGMRVIAEGVETREQFQMIHALRCSEAQGFLFSHPRGQDEVLIDMACRRGLAGLP
jgi:EAL domain-containing protein (putative c-di-GMP-specific phosphodiesterase class I)